MKIILLLLGCLFSYFASANDYGYLQLSVIKPNYLHQTNVKIILSGKEFSRISHSQNTNIRLPISSRFLASGKSTPMSSDYGELASDCQFDFSIDYSLDGSHWVSLGTYTAPSKAVSGVLPIGLCDGEICSNNADVARKIEAIQQQKWKAAGEAIKQWLEASLRREAQELNAERARIESQKPPTADEGPLLAEIDELTEDLSSQEMVELEQPTLEDPNTVLEDRITEAVSSGSVDTLVNQLSTEEKFFNACLVGDVTTQYYCQKYGGIGWLVATAEALSVAVSVEPGAAMDKLYSRIYGTNTRSSLESRAAALADFKFKIQIAQDAKRASDMMENVVNAARTGVSFTPVGDVIDICEAITGKEFCAPHGKDLLPEQRFLAILGTILSNRSTLEIVSNDMKKAIREGFNNPEPLIKAAQEIAEHSNWFDKEIVVHTLFGEYEQAKGITKLKSGMHSEDAVQSLMTRWDKEGVQFQLSEVKSVTEIPKPRIAGNTLLRYEDGSGVILYKIPDEFFLNSPARRKNFAVIFVDGVETTIYGAKTVYPKDWTPATVVESWIESKKNLGIEDLKKGEIIHKATHQGIPVYLVTDKSGVMKRAYPQIILNTRK